VSREPFGIDVALATAPGTDDERALAERLAAN
jgi:hypothetical protein